MDEKELEQFAKLVSNGMTRSLIDVLRKSASVIRKGRLSNKRKRSDPSDPAADGDDKKKKASSSKKKKGGGGSNGRVYGFFVFSRMHRDEFKQNNPAVPPQEISKLLGARWKEMTDEEKSTYNDTAREEAEAKQQQQQQATDAEEEDEDGDKKDADGEGDEGDKKDADGDATMSVEEQEEQELEQEKEEEAENGDEPKTEEEEEKEEEEEEEDTKPTAAKRQKTAPKETAKAD